MALLVSASAKTPWKVVQEKDCGWWVENDVASLARTLREMMALSENDRCEMGHMGCTLVEASYSWKAVGQALLTAYGKTVGQNRSYPVIS